jgi:hypothetical protein
MTTKCTKWTQNVAVGRKIDRMVIKQYQHLQFQDLTKFTQIGIFGLKKCHLATRRSGTLADSEEKRAQ